MSICVVCSRWGEGSLCRDCQLGLQPTPATTIAGMSVFSAFVHELVARRLVHLLKYQGIEPAARILGTAMATVLPTDTSALVPVPRAVVRRMRYGVDPAVSLAQTAALATGLPVVFALRSRLWWPAHAGVDRASRRSPGFDVAGVAPACAVLVDDVFTTGATLAAAGALLGLDRAVTATRAGLPRCE